MLKPFFIVLITLITTLLTGAMPILAGDKPVVIQAPGNTVVKDEENDLWLEKCITPYIPCSLYADSSLEYLPWTDIKTASITQLGGGWVELSIRLFEPVPEIPEIQSLNVPFVAFNWWFGADCPKHAISVLLVSYTPSPQWQGSWFEITSCAIPRRTIGGSPVKFRFSDDGVRVRVQLNDLMLDVTGEEGLIWQAGVRRVPFIYGNYETYTVDVAPSEPTTWEPR